MSKTELKPLEEAIRLAEVGEYLYNACAHSYGDGYTEPREYSIEWEWQQSKPGEYGQGQLLAASTKWHEEQAEDGIVTEAAKLRTALAATYEPVEGSGAGLTIADYEDVLADHRRLARELDIAMHGEANAAPQASLCDLIPLAKKLRAALSSSEATNGN